MASERAYADGRQPVLILTKASAETEPHRSRGGAGFQLGGLHEEQEGSLEGAARADDVSAGSEAVGGLKSDAGVDGGETSAVHHRNEGRETDSCVRVDALSPVALTQQERIAYRMGVSHGLVLAANALPPGDAELAGRLENLRIAIAARSVDCQPPEFWPERGE